MSARILHVLDATTPPEACEILALLLRQNPHACRIAALGHRSTETLAKAAGINAPITFLHSMGWADPTGWRALRRLIRDYEPTHLHAWGLPAAFAGTVVRFKGQRIVTLADLPAQLWLLPMIHKGTITGLAGCPFPCRWIVTTSWLKRELHAHSIAADAVTLIRAPMPAPLAADPRAVAALREDLGLLPEDGPVLLLGGDGGTGTFLAQPGPHPLERGSLAGGGGGGARGGPRHDLGLWAAAILQQVFPRIRAIVRQDPRARFDPGLDRFWNNLPDDDINIVAPADYSWPRLLSLADLFIISPDGPFAAGCIIHAFAAGVAVIGTPVDSVREFITDQHNGLLSASAKPRALAAAIETYLSTQTSPEARVKLIDQARSDACLRHDPAAVLRGYETHYESDSPSLSPFPPVSPAPALQPAAASPA